MNNPYVVGAVLRCKVKHLTYDGISLDVGDLVVCCADVADNWMEVRTVGGDAVYMYKSHLIFEPVDSND